MSTPASIAKHPIHPMVVALPIGAWVLAVIADIIGALLHRPPWGSLAAILIAAGILGAIVAAVPGAIDLFFGGFQGRAKRIGLFHMGFNLSAVVVFGFNLWLRQRVDPTSPAPLICSLVGMVLLTIGGWLGGDLVYRHGAAVDLAPDAEVRKGNRWVG